MRYYQSEEEMFETFEGRKVNLKQIIPVVPKAIYSITVKVDSGTMLDEIASRPNIYGEGMEAESYRIFDENIVELFESRFNMGIIPTLRVPS
jgi:hypothetical protein